MKYHRVINWSCTYRNIIILLFSVLPLVDSLNGYLVRRGSISIGSIYKIGICTILLLALCQKNNKLTNKTLSCVLLIAGYIVFSVAINVLIFQEEVQLKAFIGKLFFNITLMLLLMENYRKNIIKSTTFYYILDNSSWLLVICYLIPYVLGVGSTVYAGKMGYKAFFYAQNELSLVIIVLCYFCIYKLTLRFRVTTFIQMGLICLCGLLLNTKSTIVACLVGVGLWFFYVLLKQSFKFKIYALITVMIAGASLRNVIYTVWGNMIGRFTSLSNLYYGGSFLTSLLSGRNYYLESAWCDLMENHTIFRFFFGNGFTTKILIEMDIIDLFFYLGLIGAISSILLLFYIFRKSLYNFKADNTNIRLFSYILIIAFLNLTGHVLFMATAGCYFVLYCCFLMTFHIEDYNKVKEGR